MTQVLVVEDDAQLARALVINLQARQYLVDAVPDGATALRLVAAEQPDMILIDLGLPDMDGVDVIRALRGWSRAPVLVLSARSGSEDKIRALDAGADDYMTKPAPATAGRPTISGSTWPSCGASWSETPRTPAI